MVKLKVFEAFCGIGALHKAITRSKIDGEIVATSDWFIDSIKAYKKIHYKDKDIKLDESDYNYYDQIIWSRNSKTPIMKPLSDIEKKDLYKSCKLNKNLGNITQINSKHIPNHNLLSYSFPCQDISMMGKQLGFNEGSKTRSSLLYEIKRILLELKNENRLPQFLLMENVKNITSKKFENELNNWIIFLKELGYESESRLINSVNYGVPQIRERYFLLSQLNKKPIFENRLDKTKKNISNYIDLNFNHKVINCEHSDFKERKLLKSAILKDYTNFDSENILLHPTSYCSTITSCGANSRIKVLYNDKIIILNNKERLELMGFDSKDYLALKDFSNDKQSIMIGNSIVVNVLEDILQQIFNQLNL